MKKILFLVNLLFFSTSLFSLELNYKHISSAENISSFSVFSSDFDTFVQPLYWQKDAPKNVNVYVGIAENYYNAGVSKNFLFKEKTVYTAFSFWEKVANYGAWPNNKTDLGLSVSIGVGNFSLQGRYLDFCYSEGKGLAMPGATIGNIFLADEDYKLRVSLGTDLFFHYWKSNINDVRIPKTTVKLHYTKDTSDGVAFEYSFLPFLEGAYDKTDLSGVPNSHEFYLWYGVTTEIGENVIVGVKPSVKYVKNAINPTKSLHNFIPESDNYDFSVRVPLAVKYSVHNNIDVIFSVMFGQYYASYDHLGFKGIGGNNTSGWVTEHGMGLGVNIKPNENCKVEIGSKFIRIQEVTADNDKYSYDSKDVSATNLASEPIAISVQIKL